MENIGAHLPRRSTYPDVNDENKEWPTLKQIETGTRYSSKLATRMCHFNTEEDGVGTAPEIINNNDTHEASRSQETNTDSSIKTVKEGSRGRNKSKYGPVKTEEEAETPKAKSEYHTDRAET